MRIDRLVRSLGVALAFAVLFAGPGAEAAKKKRKKPTPTPTAVPTATPSPTPTPPELLKAAGSCLRYEAGAFIMLSEVGHPGRAFRIDAGTDITARPGGARG